MKCYITVKKETGSPVVGFAMSDQDIKKIREGVPIAVHGKEFGMCFDFILHNANTNEEIVNQLESAGLKIE